MNGIVSSWPVRVVAAYLRLCASSSGARNWYVQPAPRMRMSTGVVGEVERYVDGDGGLGVGKSVICVILRASGAMDDLGLGLESGWWRVGWSFQRKGTLRARNDDKDLMNDRHS